ncbi:Uncharacterised protein [Enterobacter hormaechei]|nr:Uncharacterised protein [Enterobacter hormaechei]
MPDNLYQSIFFSALCIGILSLCVKVEKFTISFAE